MQVFLITQRFLLFLVDFLPQKYLKTALFLQKKLFSENTSQQSKCKMWQKKKTNRNPHAFAIVKGVKPATETLVSAPLSTSILTCKLQLLFQTHYYIVRFSNFFSSKSYHP